MAAESLKLSLNCTGVRKLNQKIKGTPQHHPITIRSRFLSLIFSLLGSSSRPKHLERGYYLLFLLWLIGLLFPLYFFLDFFFSSHLNLHFLFPIYFLSSDYSCQLFISIFSFLLINLNSLLIIIFLF